MNNTRFSTALHIMTILGSKPEDLASFVTAQSSWIAEAGTYKISIGASSLDVKQIAEFQLNKDIIVKKVQPVFKAEKEFSDLKSKN